MKEYILLFRMNITTEAAQPTPQQMKLYMKKWMKWVNRISSRGQLAEGGNHLSKEGKTIKAHNVVNDCPYTSARQSVAGYLIILAKDMDDATAIAKECPILEADNNSVEIRETANPGK